MTREEWNDVPDEITGMLDQLRVMEGALLDKPEISNKGEKIIANMLHRGLTSRYNALPGKEPEVCEEVLFVGVGSKDKVEIRIFQAIEHIHNCSGITKYVVFWASTWDTGAWMLHARSFTNVKVFLKLFHADPIMLK